MAGELGVSFLGRIPFEPRLAAAADRGEPYISQDPEAPCATALRSVATAVKSFVEARHSRSQLR